VSVATTAVLLLASALAVSAALAVVGGHLRFATVLTGSMQPRIPIGSLVLARPLGAAQVRVGQVVMFKPPAPFTTPGDRPVVHRVVSVRRVDGVLALQTKGDANSAPDPWVLDAERTTLFRPVGHSAAAGQLLRAGGRTAPLLVFVLSMAAGTTVLLRRIWRGRAPSDRRVGAGVPGRHRAGAW
jgi:signal peptidase